MRDLSIKKEKNPRIKRKKCPKCHHHQMFSSRGTLGFYSYKCSKCGFMIRNK